jgi:hypothetical protein
VSRSEGARSNTGGERPRQSSCQSVSSGAPAVPGEVVEATTVEAPRLSRKVSSAVGVGQAVEAPVVEFNRQAAR